MKIRFAILAFIFLALLFAGLYAVGLKAVEHEKTPPIPLRVIEPEEMPEVVTLGEFKVTVYCLESDGGKWGYLTATGAKSTHLSTCAVDPSVIPLGTEIEVNGLVLKAVDTGSAVKGQIIDIFFDGNRGQALKWIAEFGTRHEVYLKGEENV